MLHNCSFQNGRFSPYEIRGDDGTRFGNWFPCDVPRDVPITGQSLAHQKSVKNFPKKLGKNFKKG
jgi:hypothetical protein